MKVKRDKTIDPITEIPSSTQEQYENAEEERRAKFIRDKKMKAIYTVRNLMVEMGLFEFMKLVTDATMGTGEQRDTEVDAMMRDQLLRLSRAMTHITGEHPAGFALFLSFRILPDERRAIAKWHNEDATRKATYAEITQFLQVVYEANLQEILDTFRTSIPIRIKRRRRT